MPRRTVALTGITGFFGRHLAECLLADGWHVRALVRPGRSVPPGIETVAGTLEDPRALDRLAAGAGAVLHAAGATRAVRPSDFAAVNADGTARLLESAARHAAGARIVLVSSLAAREPRLSDYAASKDLAERRARAIVPADRLVVVRPPALYGPYDRQTLSVFRAARLPLVPLVGNGRERVALAHGEDAARAVADLIRQGANGLFTLADGRPQGYSLREIIGEAARAQGLRPRFVKLPAAILPTLVRLSEVAGRVARRPALLTSDKLREMLHEDWSVDPATMPSGLAGSARGISDGFAQTAAWYRKAGWL